jgi:hypothetical protein
MKTFSMVAGLALLCAGSVSTLCGGEPAAAPAALPEDQGKVDINTADIPTLEAIPEIGTSFANAVVAARPFKSIYELERILKIGPEKMVELHAKVTVSPPKVPSPLAMKPSSANLTSATENNRPLEPNEAANRELSDEQRAEARRSHIQPLDPLRMTVPPPPRREETKPAQPAANYVWKPGHWAPVNGEWQWTPGEWALPPTRISVWIESKYDPQDQRWTPGYWQPDTIAPTESETPSSDSTRARKL